MLGLVECIAREKPLEEEGIMSRIRLHSKDPERFPEIYVGLDMPLRTYFIQVYEPAPEDVTQDHEPIDFRARWTRAEVIERIERYAADNERTQDVLRAIFLDLDPGDSVPPDYE